MTSWCLYAAERLALAPDERLGYWQDFVASQGQDGTTEDRTLFSRALREDAASLRSHEERLAFARCVRYLSRERSEIKPWLSEDALRLLFQVQNEVNPVPENQLSVEVLITFCNLQQHEPKWLEYMASLYMRVLMKIVADPEFHVSTADPNAYTFPVLLALSHVASSARFQALARAERAALLPPILQLLRTYGPPSDVPLDSWAPPHFYGALMATAFYVVREEVDDTGDLHALAMRAVLYEEPQAPCPVSMLTAAAANILAVLAAPETPDMDPGLLFDLGRKIARLLFSMVTLYVDLEGDAKKELLKKHKVGMQLETLLLPLSGQLLRMLGALEDLRPIVEEIFCTTEPPKKPREAQDGHEPNKETLRGLEHRGLYARSNKISAMMSSQTMPMVAMIIAYCMYTASQENMDLFIERFGYEACAGVMISEMSEEDYTKLKTAAEDMDERSPLGTVTVYDEDDEDVPEDAMPPEELLERLQRLQEYGITHGNPVEEAAKLGILERLEARVEARQRANEARELAEAEAEVAKLHLGRS
ncbi:hypothetical protein MCAP1_002958 [Malassezia caprae]|uniref:Uncharacterized protein n=1 Tax=Malassezia caprae TaxID=1381934 RepID=A0AAF0IWJ6_9BASI|nr:hypothetical protein MCAP1_002958 [Malassezia caprae]